MDWTPYNNTTPWGLLNKEQQEQFLDLKKERYCNKFWIGADGLDYSDYTYEEWRKCPVELATSRIGAFQRYYNNWGKYEWSVATPGNSSVIRATGPFTKAPPAPRPREFFIVMDHGKLIGYFNDYPVALQHYEIIKVKEQL